MIPAESRLFRAYLNASHSAHGQPLYHAAVLVARDLHMAGASVFLVDLCFGTHRQLRDARSEYLFVDIPVVFEVVDSAEKMDLLKARLAPMIDAVFATEEPVRVVRYAHHGDRSGPVSSSPGEDPGHQQHRFDPGRTPPMPSEGAAERVTVYVGSSDTWHGRNLAMAIVEHCRKAGIAGATASLGVMGFGKSSHIHRAHLLSISGDLPERVEIVDSAEQIEKLLPALETMVEGGLIIREEVRTIRYGHHPKA